MISITFHLSVIDSLYNVRIHELMKPRSLQWWYSMELFQWENDDICILIIYTINIVHGTPLVEKFGQWGFVWIKVYMDLDIT